MMWMVTPAIMSPFSMLRGGTRRDGVEVEAQMPLVRCAFLGVGTEQQDLGAVSFKFGKRNFVESIKSPESNTRRWLGRCRRRLRLSSKATARRCIGWRFRCSSAQTSTPRPYQRMQPNKLAMLKKRTNLIRASPMIAIPPFPQPGLPQIQSRGSSKVQC